MRKYMTYVMTALVAFGVGVNVHSWLRGSVRITHNMKVEGDLLNRGQIYVEIELPHGMRLGQIRLPGGGAYPDLSKPRWVEVLPSGEEKTWIDHLRFETYRWPGPAPAEYAAR